MEWLKKQWIVAPEFCHWLWRLTNYCLTLMIFISLHLVFSQKQNIFCALYLSFVFYNWIIKSRRVKMTGFEFGDYTITGNIYMKIASTGLIYCRKLSKKLSWYSRKENMAAWRKVVASKLERCEKNSEQVMVSLLSSCVLWMQSYQWLTHLFKSEAISTCTLQHHRRTGCEMILPLLLPPMLAIYW